MPAACQAVEFEEHGVLVNDYAQHLEACQRLLDAERKGRTEMILYHRTSAAAAILQKGFQNRRKKYGTDRLWTGVFFSDVPLDETGASGEELLQIRIPSTVIREYEWIQEGLGYREFLIPARIVNKYGPPKIVAERAPSQRKI